MVASTILHPESIACRILEFKPLRYIGRLSYGLYLWQQIFVIVRDTVHWPMSALQHFPFVFICPAVCTVISYYLLEKRMIALGHRLAPPATPGRPDAEEPAALAAVPAVSPVIFSASHHTETLFLTRNLNSFLLRCYTYRTSKT